VQISHRFQSILQIHGLLSTVSSAESVPCLSSNSRSRVVECSAWHAFQLFEQRALIGRQYQDENVAEPAAAADSILSAAAAVEPQSVGRHAMNSSRARRALLAVAGLGAGLLITEFGFVLQRQQMMRVLETRSVRPALDSSRNFLIAACQPVLAVADRLVDYGPVLFVVLLVLNVAFWAVLFYLATRRLSFVGVRPGGLS
jgi:hypothetical protein